MKPNIRATVAAVALSHATGRKVSSIFAYSGGGYMNIDMSVSGNKVSGYDYSTSSFIDGSIPSLYHYGESSFIDFKKSGSKYDGYDYGSSSFFEVKVNGSQADLYDYGVGSYFAFSL